MKNKQKQSIIRRLYTHDNLPILRSLDSESVDLIYLDPPFNSGKKWENPIGEGSKRALASFKDTWEKSDTHEDEKYALSLSYPKTISLINALNEINGGSWEAYLIYMGARLAEMRRIIKPHGSIFYHCDPTMSHGIKLLMDAIFGGKAKDAGNFCNEIVWCYTGPGSPRMRQFNRKHDIILWYAAGKKWVFNADAVRMPHKDGAPHAGGFSGGGVNISDTKYAKSGKVPETWWDELRSGMTPVRRLIKENTGYPTQKPLALLERIIKASSNEGDVVLDPFCGCGTACLAAERLGRQWLGIDLAEEAATLVRDRLQKDGEGKLAFAAYEVEHLRKLPKRTDLRGLRSDDAILKPRLYKLQNKICIGCENETRIELMDFDHIIAKSRGGQNIDENIQLLCRDCNSTKGDRGMHYLWRTMLEKRTREMMKKYEDKRRRLAEKRTEN